MYVCVYLCVRVCACVRACVRVCLCVLLLCCCSPCFLGLKGTVRPRGCARVACRLPGCAHGQLQARVAPASGAYIAPTKTNNECFLPCHCCYAAQLVPLIFFRPSHSPLSFTFVLLCCWFALQQRCGLWRAMHSECPLKSLCPRCTHQKPRTRPRLLHWATRLPRVPWLLLTPQRQHLWRRQPCLASLHPAAHSSSSSSSSMGPVSGFSPQRPSCSLARPPHRFQRGQSRDHGEPRQKPPQTDRQADRHTPTLTDTDRHRHRQTQTQTQTDRHTDTHTDTHTQTHRHTDTHARA